MLINPVHSMLINPKKKRVSKSEKRSGFIGKIAATIKQTSTHKYFHGAFFPIMKHG